MSIIKRIQYNSPVILTYAIVSLILCVINYLTNAPNQLLFSVYRSSFADPFTYIRLIGHVLGHRDFSHYLNNFLLILLVGPMLEEKYGSVRMLVIMLITAIITGAIFVLVSSKALLGASGIVFMLILLSSFANFKRGGIPLTLVLVIIAYIGNEVYQGFASANTVNNISHFTHIIGGLCGAAAGFFIHSGKIEKVEEPADGKPADSKPADSKPAEIQESKVTES